MVVSNIFYFHPDFGEMIQFDLRIFFRWVEKNHQPERQFVWSEFSSLPLQAFDELLGPRGVSMSIFEKMSEVALIQFNLLRFDGSVDWWIGWLIDGWIDWLIDWLVNDLFHSVRQSFSQSTIDFVEPNQPVNQFVDVFISPVLLLHGLMLQQAFSEQFQDLSLK